MEPAIFLASTMFWGYCLINNVNIDIAAREGRAYLLLPFKWTMNILTNAYD